jgi:hypothetical protein
VKSKSSVSSASATIRLFPTHESLSRREPRVGAAHMKSISNSYVHKRAAVADDRVAAFRRFRRGMSGWTSSPRFAAKTCFARGRCARWARQPLAATDTLVSNDVNDCVSGL